MHIPNTQLTRSCKGGWLIPNVPGAVEWTTVTCTMFDDLPPVVSTDDTNSIETISINVLEITSTLESQDIKTLQGQDAYLKHINNTLPITSIHDKFIMKYNILYELINDSYKPSEGLVVSKSLALTILIKSHVNMITFKNKLAALFKWNPHKQFDTVPSNFIGPCTAPSSKGNS